jgi:hypothetical protein
MTTMTPPVKNTVSLESIDTGSNVTGHCCLA